MKALPAELGLLVNLKVLDLRANKLKALPAEFSQMSRLSTLLLDDNNFTELPAHVWKLTHLKVLGVSANELVAVPAALGRLKQLSKLSLNNNRLEIVPREIGDLVHLAVLRLSNNVLTHLPSELGRLSRLQELHLDGNRLSDIQDWDLDWDSLICLEALDLRKNMILHLPSELLVHQTKLTVRADVTIRAEPQGHSVRDGDKSWGPEAMLGCITKELDDEKGGLMLRGLRLDRVPDAVFLQRMLTVLDLGSNSLTSLPKEFKCMTALQSLRLNDNKLTSIENVDWGPLIRAKNLLQLDLRENQILTLPRILLSDSPVQVLVNVRLRVRDGEEVAVPDAQNGMRLCDRSFAVLPNLVLVQRHARA